MIELEHAWGAGRSHKYIAKIGNRYFYTQDEIQAYKQGAQKKAGNAFDTARKGALTVKKKVDSVPRIQKHGSKYYVADKKTQRKIEKSGAGGNDFYKVGSGHYKITKNGAGKMIAKDAGVIYRAKTTNSDKIRDAVVKGTAAAKVKARESAYSKYELGNVTKYNQGKAKVKQLTGDAIKKADNVADKFKKKAKDVKNDVVNAPDNAKKAVKNKIANTEIVDGYKIKDAVRDKKEAEKFLANPEGYVKDYIQEEKRKKKNAQTKKIKKTLKANSNRTVKSHYGELNR